MKSKLQEMYAAWRDRQGGHEVARALLGQMDWFHHVAEFDPKTGEALPQSLSTVLGRIAGHSFPDSDQPIRDRLWRIAEHSRLSVERLFRALNESPRREHALLAVHAVRELDANSFIKLSNRPGRTVREKLAGKPYLQAVRRFQSVDLPENRLLKAFAMRLAELLELRLEFLGDDHDLLKTIQSWMRSEDAQAIGRWDNLPPNNVLLSHRDYRRIWDGWRSLQRLDDDIAHDRSELDARNETMQRWSEYARTWAAGGHLFAEIPVRFNFDKFEVRTWPSELVMQKSRQRVSRHAGKEAIAGPACVDLASLRPRYATESSSGSLRDTYLWQQWRAGGESIDLDLFDVDAAYLHADATSISSADLFFSRSHALGDLDRAARTFASRLRDTFTDNTLFWLVPDALNDFELEVARRHLNARFADAEPLPRSVAAIFVRVDHEKIKADGCTVAVVDNIGEKVCVTRLVARSDPRLAARVPENKGFYWERCPPVVLSERARGSDESTGYELITVDGQGQWRDARRPSKPQFIDASALRADPRIGSFAFCIDLTEAPVQGGIRLHSLQRRAGDIPLWRDQIPELSIRVMKDGRYQRFPLVSRGSMVKPLRGVSVSIPVAEAFTLPAGKPFYQFPLFQGENARELGFSARLDSPAFPLKEDVACELELSFEYGADQPYRLVFTARDESFPAVQASWRKTEEMAITDASSPEFPTPMSWAELRHMPKRDSGETSDLLDWVLNGIERFKRGLPRKTGSITKPWLEDRRGRFTYVRCEEISDEIRIHEDTLLRGVSPEDLYEGDKVSFEWHEKGGRSFVGKVAKAGSSELTRSMVGSLRKGLRFPIIQVWRDGSSIDDTDCPPDFADDMRTCIEDLLELSQDADVPRPVRQELLFLLACMHNDAPRECIEWIEQQVRSGALRDPKAVGYALGDVSAPWQKAMLARLLAAGTRDSLRAFAYAIWRAQHFVDKFDATELSGMLRLIMTSLSEVIDAPPRHDEKDKRILRQWTGFVTELLELLLGLLRTRASSNDEVRMLLQPQQKVSRELANQIERVGDMLAQSGLTLPSRINLQQAEGSRQPPGLLLVLSLYLTGDDGANAIHITSVADGESE
jgi:hypothetical protein